MLVCAKHILLQDKKKKDILIMQKKKKKSVVGLQSKEVLTTCSKSVNVDVRMMCLLKI